MSRAPNYYTRKLTGETLTTAEWCRDLGITDTEFRRRVARYGLTEKTFAPKQTTPRRKHPEWDQVERDFLKECVDDPAWRLCDIMEKLERCEDDVRGELRRLGLSNKVTRRPSINWKLVWRMANEDLPPEAIGRVLDVTGAAVRYALRKMRAMSDAEREQYFKDCGY